ncbi:DnaJ- protein scj1 [Malassezia vespertilionis]|uniref:Scj1p n=1 Tax=Malassezia vespertilionis TaxID=2020962 RepID=A0A2N1J7Q4_9BASI|nr:DnaJ- protein scj1 [Malassezia vespertilionis]PKI82588.1 Scj1p [Malassezia vespertilionis]WFD08493.1 DnaJ- protein scj1 [Malassezia vespertilionis]
MRVVVCILWLVCAACLARASDYYNVLGVDRRASAREIKSAYRRIARAIHPDKHPDKAAEFMELSEAYQVLSDETLRNVYDTQGADAAKQYQSHQSNGGGRPQSAYDLFSQFFGGTAPDETPKGPRKIYEAELSMQEIYNGRQFPLVFDRNVVCPQCMGSGAASSAHIHTCTTCNGGGVQIVRQQIMPGFVTNMQVTCQTCGGAGKMIQKVCARCKGEKIVVDEAEIEVSIDAGARDGAEYVFEGMSDQSPDTDAGDIAVIVKTVSMPGDFRRNGHNLYYTMPISLEEALFGFTHRLTHYDGHTFTVQRTGVTQPGHVVLIIDEGLPIAPDDREAAQGETHGDLFVTLNVVLPETRGSRRKALQEALVQHGQAHTEL